MKRYRKISPKVSRMTEKLIPAASNIAAEDQAILKLLLELHQRKMKPKRKFYQLHNVFNYEDQSEDIPVLIDQKDNAFIMSNPNSKYLTFHLLLEWSTDSCSLIKIDSTTTATFGQSLGIICSWRSL